MSGMATAVIGSAVIGAVVSSNNARKAANAQNAATNAANLQGQIAQEQWDKYQEIYDPLEKQYVKEATNAGSPEAFQRAAGAASATVGEQFGKARERLTRTPGLDASTPAYAASMAGLDLAQAASDATQQNVARTNQQNTARAWQTDALSLGKGLAANASNSANSAAQLQAGIASQQLAQGNQTAANWGNVANRVIGSLPSSNWLGNAPGTTVSTPGWENNYYNDAAGNATWGAGQGPG